MNKVILMGRLTRDPDIRYTQGADPIAVARYTLAVDRRVRRDSGGQTADFISCVAFRKSAEFAEKYLRKGIKIAIAGHLQTGSYVNRNGAKVYTTDVVVEEHDFCEGRTDGSAQAPGNGAPGEQGYFGGGSPGIQEQEGDDPTKAPPCPQGAAAEGFMTVPDGIEEELPFI